MSKGKRPPPLASARRAEFTLESGDVIRDEGRELFYSPHAEKAHGVALAYAALKWGKRLATEKGCIMFQQEQEVDRWQGQPHL